MAFSAPAVWQGPSDEEHCIPPEGADENLAANEQPL